MITREDYWVGSSDWEPGVFLGLGGGFLEVTMRKKVVSQSVQSLSHVRLFATPWTAACQASLSITNSRSPPKPMSIESVIPSKHLFLCHPLLLLPSIFLSIRVFSNESVLHIRWPKELQLQHQSFQWTPRTYLLEDGLVGSPCSPRDSQESSPIPQLKSINSSVLSFLHSPKVGLFLDILFLLLQWWMGLIP